MGGYAQAQQSRTEKQSAAMQEPAEFANGVEMTPYAMDGAYALPAETLTKLEQLPTQVRTPRRKEVPYLPERVNLHNAHQLSTQPLKENVRSVEEMVAALQPPSLELKDKLDVHRQQMESLQAVWLGFQAERGQGQWSELMSNANARASFTDAMAELNQATGDREEAGLAKLAANRKFKDSVAELESATMEREAKISQFQSWKAQMKQEEAERGLEKLSSKDKNDLSVVKDIEAVAKSLLTGGPLSALSTLGTKLKPRITKKLSKLINADEKTKLLKIHKASITEREMMGDKSYRLFIQAQEMDISRLQESLVSLVEELASTSEIEDTRDQQVGSSLASVSSVVARDTQLEKIQGASAFSELEQLFWNLQTSGDELMALADHISGYILDNNVFIRCGQAIRDYQNQYHVHIDPWAKGSSPDIEAHTRLLSWTSKLLNDRMEDVENIFHDASAVQSWLAKDSSTRAAVKMGTSMGETIIKDSAS